MLGKRLKQLREEKKLLQKDIAKLLNISASAYGFYEQDKREPSTETISFLANYFEVSIDYLLGNSNIKNSKKNTSSDISTEDALMIAIKNMLGREPTEEELKKYLDMTKLFFDVQDQ